MLKKSLTGVALGLLLVTAVWAQSVVSASVDTQTTYQGGQITLTIAVTGEPDDQSGEQPDLPNLEAFAVSKVGVSRQFSFVNGQSSSNYTYTYVLTARQVGKFTIPPITIKVDGQPQHSSPLVVEVVRDMALSATRNPSQPVPRSGYMDPNIRRPAARPNLRNPFNRGLPPLDPNSNPWGGPPGSVPDPSTSVDRVPAQAPVRRGPEVAVEADVSKPTPYVNEPVIHKFRFLHRVNLTGNPSFEAAQATGFIREDLGQKTYQDTRNGENYSISEAQTVFFPTSTGSFQIGPTRLTCRISIEDFAAFDNFNNLIDTNRELVTNAIPLNVRALPSAGRPSDFSGGVGSFSIKTSVASREVEQGKPINLTITIEGDGHPDFVSQPLLPDNGDFKYYKAESKSHVTTNEVFRGEKIFTVPMVVLKNKDVTFPAIQLSYFDPRSERYETVVSQPIALKVTPSKQPLKAEATPSAHGSENKEEADSPMASFKSGELRPVSHQTSGWLWALQLLPWLGLVGMHLSRKLGQAWKEHSLQSFSGKIGSRTQKKIRSSDVNTTNLGPLLYSYLEEKLKVRLTGCSFGDLEKRLSEQGLSPDCASQWRQLLTSLEESRYAPGNPEDRLAAFKDLAQKLVQEVESRP